MAQQYTYGIDFGTCNSVIEVFDHGQNAVLDVAGHFENALESSIYFPQGETTGYSLGNEALQNYLGTDLKGRFIKSLKSALSAPFLNEITIHGKRFELVKLVSFFLSELKQRADSHLGANVDRVILGRPARFSADPMEDQVAEQRLVKAARQAGFRDIRLLQEPIAAAVAFQAFSNTDEQILIGDIGAGTSDFALIQSEKALANLFDKHAIQTAGVKRGGDDFDAQVMWEHIVAHFGYGSEYESYQRLLPIPSHIFWNLCYWEKLSLVNKKDLLKSLQKFHHTTPDNAKIGRLIHLMEENLGFQQERRDLIAKNELARARVEATLQRLRSMEAAS